MPDESRFDDAHEWRKSTDGQIGSLRSDVSELKTGLGQVKEGQAYLAQTVTEAMRVIRENGKPKETNWAVLIALLGLIVVIAGGFTTLTVNPITKNQDVMIERIQALENTDAGMAKFQGQSEIWRDKTQREMDTLWVHAQESEAHNLTLVEATAYARGRQDAYEGRLDRLSQRLEKLGERTYNAKP